MTNHTTTLLPTPQITAAQVAALERAEITGYTDQWRAAPASNGLGIDHATFDGVHCTAVAAQPGLRLLNHALGLGGRTAPDPQVLDAIERFYRQRGLPTLVAVEDGSAIEPLLRSRGYAQEYAWVKFARDTAAPAPVECDLEIRTLSPQHGPSLGVLLTEAFDLSPALVPWFAALPGRQSWRCLGAFDGEELVATGSLVVDGHAGWVTWGATRASHRGRRAQKALLAARIALARDLGLGMVVTETGDVGEGLPDPSHRNILAAGFGAAYRRPFWRLT